MRVVSDLHTNNYGPIVDESLHLVRRLSWIMFYFYGAMSRFAVWMSSQTVRGSVAQDNEVRSLPLSLRCFLERRATMSAFPASERK